MMPEYKRKELGIATEQEVEELKHTLPQTNEFGATTTPPIKKGERYLSPVNALLCQSWDEQLYIVKIADEDIGGGVVFMPYIDLTK